MAGVPAANELALVPSQPRATLKVLVAVFVVKSISSIPAGEAEFMLPTWIFIPVAKPVASLKVTEVVEAESELVRA
jgi:hypothetical protein